MGAAFGDAENPLLVSVRSGAAVSMHGMMDTVLNLDINDAVQSLPTLIQHGTQDQQIDVDRARDSVARLRELKVPLIFKEYAMGHEISPKGLYDLSAWLEEKVRATGRSPSQ